MTHFQSHSSSDRNGAFTHSRSRFFPWLCELTTESTTNLPLPVTTKEAQALAGKTHLCQASFSLNLRARITSTEDTDWGKLKFLLRENAVLLPKTQRAQLLGQPSPWGPIYNRSNVPCLSSWILDTRGEARPFVLVI